jgi:glycine cleavage system H protein
LVATIHLCVKNQMNFPDDLYYTKEHEWIRIENETATIGITDFAQSELGDIVFVEVNSTGTPLTKDVVFGTIEAVKTVSDLFLPMGGIIEEINPLLQDNPEQVNTDPYGDGWIIKLKIENGSEINELMNAQTYQDMIS